MSSLRLFHIGFPQGGRGSVLPIHRSTVRHLELLTQGSSAQPPVPASFLLTLLELCPGSWINPAEGSNKHPQSLQRLNGQGGAPGSAVCSSCVTGRLLCCWAAHSSPRSVHSSEAQREMRLMKPLTPVTHTFQWKACLSQLLQATVGLKVPGRLSWGSMKGRCNGTGACSLESKLHFLHREAVSHLS